MIIFLTTDAHAYTHRELVGADATLEIRVLDYRNVLQRDHIPRATYVFTDLDRLPTEVLSMTAQLYIRLSEQGVRVLNNPARVLSRYGLLRALHLEGINRFNAYRVEEGVMPQRWPAFLRTDGTHSGPFPELYGSVAELEAGIELKLASGVPCSRLLIVEFMAEQVRPGLFRKLSCFRVGPSSVAHTCVHDTDWIAKHGKTAIASPELYDEELRIVRDNPYRDVVEQVFDLAGTDYGRIDFGVVGGDVQIYEINTNPHIKLGSEHPSPARLESYRVFARNFLEAMKAIDLPPS